MAIWLGPVFQAELVGTARKPRFFVGRVLYGLLVLFIVTTTYYNMSWRYGDQAIPIDQLASFGQAIFAAFAGLQGTVLLVMTPSLVAGAIADERQRKTLHYLMASQLSSGAIVLGKIGARLLRMVVLALIGLPVLALVGLFGGIDYPTVALVYAATATTTFLLAGLAILCSVYAAKPRDAIVQTFFFELIWFLLPTTLLATMSLWSPRAQAVGEFCAPALEWIEAASPATLLRQTGMLRSLSALLEKTFWMMGLQVAYGTLLLLLAAWRLRPAYRNMEGPSFWARTFKRGRGSSSRLRIFRRPPVGDDAILWKELHVNRTSDVRKIVLALLCVATVGFVAYAAWDEIAGAVDEAIHAGYWNFAPHQRVVNGFLRAGNAGAIVILLFGLAAVGASSVTSEREGDTWINLASSPIEGGELIRGKIWGALWVFRPLYVTLGACWAFGLLVGSIRPLGVVACLIELVVFTYFAASLGVAFSLRAKNTVQAMALTFGLLFATNAGYLFAISLIVNFPGPIIFTGCMPLLFTVSLLGGDELNTGGSETGELIVACVVGTISYAIAAVVLQETAIWAYDRVVDRPDRGRNSLTPEQLRLIQAEVPARSS